MAKDLARHIYKLAYDTDGDTEDLQKFYEQRLRQSKREIYDQLHEIVKAQMKKTLQPAGSSMRLPGSIQGSNCRFESLPEDKKSKLAEEDKIYLQYSQTSKTVYIVTNEESRFLIKHAIIPLRLKWSIVYDSQIEVSWDHWVENQNH